MVDLILIIYNGVKMKTKHANQSTKSHRTAFDKKHKHSINKLAASITKIIGITAFSIQFAHASGEFSNGEFQFKVTSTADQPQAGLTTLREAVEQANAVPESEIVFDNNVFNTAQRITLENGDILISSSVFIDGPGAELLTISGNNESRIFTIEDSIGDQANVTINQVTLTAGNGISEVQIGRGGCVLNRENLTLNSTVVTGCDAGGAGGGVWTLGGDLTVNDSTITNSVADRRGGGLYLRDAVIEINNSTIANNSALNEEGGGIYTDARADVTINNSTITGNFAAQGGDGVYVRFNTSTLSLNQVTVYKNNENGIQSPGDVSLTNSIIAGHTENDCVLNTASLNTLSNNLDTDSSCDVDAVNHITVSDPMLEPLANFGGPTLTHRPMPGSPMIDAGDDPLCLDFDQRGVERPQDGDADNEAVCDIGAVELAETEDVPQEVIFKDSFDVFIP